MRSCNGTKRGRESPWTPKATQNSQRTRSGGTKTSFAEETVSGKNNEVKSNKKKKGVVKELEHKYQFVAKGTLKIPQNDNVENMALQMIIKIIQKLQKRDKCACMVCPLDNKLAYKLADLPQEWINFYDGWSA